MKLINNFKLIFIYRTIYFDQAQLGMNREYLVRGLEDNDVKNYFNFMQKVEILVILIRNLLVNIFQIR